VPNRIVNHNYLSLINFLAVKSHQRNQLSVSAPFLEVDLYFHSLVHTTETAQLHRDLQSPINKNITLKQSFLLKKLVTFL